MVVVLVFRKVKSFLLFLVAIWKRALCCFRRRRRLSEFAPLTQVGVVSNQSVESAQENWSDWNEQIVLPPSKPTTIQEHIEYYRQQAIAARQAHEEQTDALQEDLFEDMAPTITKQTKLYLNNKKQEGNGNISRSLSLDPEAVLALGQELGEWDDNSGWEDPALEWDAREALRESRKQARQKKVWEQQQQRRQEKFTRSALGAKVSS